MAEYIPMLNKFFLMIQKFHQYLKLLWELLLIRMSELFDKDWYLTKNPDVAIAKVDPWLHYLRYGGFEGRDPGPNFSSSWYLDTYEDVKKAGINPLIHFLKCGRAEGRTGQSSLTVQARSAKIDTQQKDIQFMQPDPIIVHQMGKVGSKTVELSLIKAYEALGIQVPIYHTHALNGFDWGRKKALQEQNQRNPKDTLAALAYGEQVRKQVDENPAQHWNIVSLVRDPIARNIATFFEGLPEYIPDWRERYAHGTLSVHELQALFLSTSSAYERLDQWFDSQMKLIPAFGIDVYATPFPHSLGYKIYPSISQASLLLIRLENLNECAKRAIHEYLGLENFSLHSTNLAAEKEYAALYRAFKELPLPVEYVDGMYKTQFTRHFYSDLELDVFTERWTKSSEITSNNLSDDKRIAEMEKSVQLLTAQVVAKERSTRALRAQISSLEERDLELSKIKISKAWRLAMFFRRIRLILVPPNSLRSKVMGHLFNIIVLPLIRIVKKQNMENDLTLIRSSKLFDAAWYLTNNPDVASARVDPVSHYVRHGGFEGRDPGPNFSSSWYLDTYEDVKKAGINPLVHYIRHGQEEGRMSQPQPVQSEPIEFTTAPYQCPVCQKQVHEFLPLPALYLENFEKYGYPYTAADDIETTNVEQYSCPHCGASDRDRLYTCYLEEKLSQYAAGEQILMLDIAPSHALSHFIEKFKQVDHHTADLLVEGVDLAIDITNMPEIDPDSYDILICSHVLEHVSDDKKALSELYRVLKPGGWGIIMVPIILTLDQIDEDPQLTDIAERWRRFGQDDHVRLYNKSGFIERVEAAGFTLYELGVEYFGEPVFRQYGITNTSILYVVEKKIINIPKPPIKRKCDFFFIVGTGRSGTTLMAQVLNAHSQICVPGELQIAFETSNNGARLAEIFASMKNLRFRAEDYINLVQERCPHTLDDYYDYQAFFHQLDYPITSLQWLLTELYTDIAYSQGKSIFAEQTPWYGQNINLLNQLFPQAKFIHMVRDGRDVAISFARTPWWHKDVNLNLEQWTSEVNKIEEDGSRWVKQRMLIIRYEDFISTPEKVTKEVCDFLDVPFENTMLNLAFHIDYGQFSKHTDKEAPSLAYQKWQRKKKTAFFSDSLYGWKTNHEVNFDNISRSTRQLLKRFGYED